MIYRKIKDNSFFVFEENQVYGSVSGTIIETGEIAYPFGSFTTVFNGNQFVCNILFNNKDDCVYLNVQYNNSVIISYHRCIPTNAKDLGTCGLCSDLTSNEPTNSVIGGLFLIDNNNDRFNSSNYTTGDGFFNIGTTVSAQDKRFSLVAYSTEEDVVNLQKYRLYKDLKNGNN